MEPRYTGALKLTALVAQVDLSGSDASVKVEYHLYNPGSDAQRPEFSVLRMGEASLALRAAGGPAPAGPRRRLSAAVTPVRAASTVAIAPAAAVVLDEDSVEAVHGGKTKTFTFTPALHVTGLPVMQRAARYSATFVLPQEAKKLVYSSAPTTQVAKVDGRLHCVFERAQAFPGPIVVKWTELPVDLAASKTVVEKPGGVLEVTIRLRNDGADEVKGVTLIDEYSAAGVAPIGNQPNVKPVNPGGRSARVIHHATVDVPARAEKVLTYSLRKVGIGTSIPPTEVKWSGELVAIAAGTGFRPVAPLSRPPRAAFALPSGWSFDYLNGGDHHINEHGMWCDGEIYDAARQKLRWNTGAIYADSNLDDDYRWATFHQVLRFDPGFAHHVNSPWLAKTGNVTAVPQEFRHEDLRLFQSAVVLIRGWRFDFTSDDHHINRAMLWLDDVQFDRALGLLRWSVKVTWADKNFDDNYRFLYDYTILGFNGAVVACEFSGHDKGGSVMHAGEVANAALKSYSGAIVVPMGWSFDFTSDDHHINEHTFKLQNVAFDRNAGTVKWTAHMGYADKNFDDDYDWKYRVAVLGTSSGEAREYSPGVQSDDGGLDSMSCAVDLGGLFQPITWTNGVCDGTETGVDCGGRSPAADLGPIRAAVDPGDGDSAQLLSLRREDQQTVVRLFANAALLEYADARNQDPTTFYAAANPARPDRYVEAVAWYVDRHMRYVSDGSRGGSQSAYTTLTATAHRGPGDFNGDCEDFAILRAALLRALGFGRDCIFCADHHDSYDQGQVQECYGTQEGGGHTFNVVVYQGKYRILDYGLMRNRYWAHKQAWIEHVVDNIWNDHTGKHWDRKDVTPFATKSPLVNYPGNPCSPSANWDWRTYYCDVTL